jgi:hypothetical protein
MDFQATWGNSELVSRNTTVEMSCKISYLADGQIQKTSIKLQIICKYFGIHTDPTRKHEK